MKNPSNKKRLVWIATGAAALGAGFGIANVASAASGSGSSTGSNTIDVTAPVASTATPPAPDQQGRPMDPALMTHGPGETPLTGSDLSGVTTAVKSVDPTGTIIRAETDSDGHTFEAHVKEADGAVKTYYFTSTYQADGSIDGFGSKGPQGGPHGGPDDRPQPPAPGASGATTTGA